MKTFFSLIIFTFLSCSNVFSFDSTVIQHTTIWQDINSDFMTGLSDAGGYVTLPGHTSVEEWFIDASILDALFISTCADYQLKQIISTNTSHNDYNHNFWDLPTAYGETVTAVLISGGTYFTGLFSRDNSIRITGRMLVETILFSGSMDIVLKFLVGHDSPYFRNDPNFYKAFQTKDEHVSFPSGHTTMAFAISTVLAERIDNNYARIGLYGLAALTGYARMKNDKHWFSDVLAGGVLGFGTGFYVVHREDERSGKTGGFSVYPSMNGINFNLKW